jgi:invasion protein IalB
MTLYPMRSFDSSRVLRSIAATCFAMSISMAGTIANGQQVIPFGDVPATPDFSDAEIAARGQQKRPDLTYSGWKKLCFRGVQGAETTMVCRTIVEGKSDLGQIILRVDLIERENAPAARLQVFLPSELFLQPGIKLTVDNGASMQVPFTICLANGCVAATIADPAFIHQLDSGRMLAVEGVNFNVRIVIASLPLDDFANAHQGAAAQIFEQKLEGKWEQPSDVGNAK